MNWTYAAHHAGGLGDRRSASCCSTRQPLGVDRRGLAAIALGAFCGGMIGAKLPFVLADWPGFLSGTAWFDDGKTIMSGLVGGYLGAMITEWALGIQGLACDMLAAPLAAGIGIGRLACFQAGCCYGIPTSLPWGVNFGDGCPRHPTQLYESAFHLTAAVVLFQLQRRQMFRGQLVRLYFVAYFVFRFVTEFIRPEPRIYFGLTGYQMGTLLLAPFFALWCCPGGAAAVVSPWRRQPAGSIATARRRSSAEADADALPAMPEAGGRGDLRARRQGLLAAAMPGARHDRRPGLFRPAALLSPRRSAAPSAQTYDLDSASEDMLASELIRWCCAGPSLLHRAGGDHRRLQSALPGLLCGEPVGRASRRGVDRGRRASIHCRAGAVGRLATQRRRTARCIRNCWRSSTNAGSCRSNTS